MNEHMTEMEAMEADPAAVFAAALSLWQTCHKAAGKDSTLNLSEVFNGIDQMMREVVRIAGLFEKWACVHVAFEELPDVWPYRLKEDFGDACMTVMRPTGLVQFDEHDCLRVALELRLPVKLHGELRVPIDLRVANPHLDSEFRQFRIQTVRDHREDGDVYPFSMGDEPFDEELTAPYFALYGMDAEGMSEHIADRRSYAEITELVRKILPHIHFPEIPTIAWNMAPFDSTDIGRV